MKSFALTILFLLSGNIGLAQNTAEDAVNETVNAADDSNDVAVNAAVAPNQRGNVFGVDFRNLVAARRFQLTQDFLVEVDEIKSVCNLNEDQLAKLTVGAKGAVKKLMAEWETHTILKLGIFAANNPAIVDAIEEAKSAFAQTGIAIHDTAEIEESTYHYLKKDFLGGSFAQYPAAETQFWESTVSSVLTETQTSKLAKYREKRAVAKRQAAIAMCMSTLDFELGLNDEQKTGLLALVVPEVESIRINCSPINEVHLIYYFISKIDRDGLADEILSPAQSQKLRMFLVPQKNICQEIEIVVEKESFRMEMLQTKDLPNPPKGID